MDKTECAIFRQLLEGGCSFMEGAWSMTLQLAGWWREGLQWHSPTDSWVAESCHSEWFKQSRLSDHLLHLATRQSRQPYNPASPESSGPYVVRKRAPAREAQPVPGHQSLRKAGIRSSYQTDFDSLPSPAASQREFWSDPSLQSVLPLLENSDQPSH